MFGRISFVLGALLGAVAAVAVAVAVVLAVPGATTPTPPPKPTAVVLPQDTSPPLPVITAAPSGGPDVVRPSSSIAPFGDQ